MVMSALAFYNENNKLCRESTDKLITTLKVHYTEK